MIRKKRCVLSWLAVLAACLAAPALAASDWPAKGGPWAVPSLPYRILVEAPAVDIGNRSSDALVAALELDFTAAAFATLKLPGAVDLDSIQVLRCDPGTGATLPAPAWPFSRTEGERVSRFLDLSLPKDFVWGGPPKPGVQPRTFPRGGYYMNARGKGKPGLLVWDHAQQGQAASRYAIYFDTLAQGAAPKIPRHGFLGDGLPRRDVETGSLTGSLYNRVAVDDWDGDGLADMLVGMGFGHILLFRNEGTRRSPKFNAGEYLTDSTGQILSVGSEAVPFVTDWNGDGKLDLVLGLNHSEGHLAWYENVGSNAARKLAYRGFIQVGGQNLVTPVAPCPEAPHYKKDYAPTVQVVDWDDDGDADLLLGGYVTGHLWLYENTGKAADGTPTLAFRGPIEADGKPIDTIWSASPCATDLDGDGDLDLLTGSFGQAKGGGDAFHRFLIYYENIGTRREPKLTEKPIAYDGEPPRDILAQARPFDFNGDGLTDLAISTFGAMFLAENAGTRKAPRWKVERLKAAWGLSALSTTQVIDWNGDGHIDLIRSPLDSHGGPHIALNLGKGTHGVFGPSEPMLPPGQAISHPAPYGDPWAFVHLCDFDGNGVLDLLWADGPGNAYLHRNRGTDQKPDFDTQGEKLMLSSGKPIKVGPPVVPIDQIKDFTVMQGSRAGLTARDFNGDGRTDLAIGDAYGDVYFFQNVGTNAKPLFAEPVKLGNLVSRAIPLAYDWDRDGRVDLLGVAWSGRMEWYRNMGVGASPLFAAPQKLDLPPTVPYSPRLVIADWNADGDDDLLVMSSYPWFCWLEGSYLKHGYVQARILAVERKNGR